MNRNMFVFFILLVCFPSGLFAAENIKISILPFKISGQSELAYLKTDIPDMLGIQLKKSGAQIVAVDQKVREIWETSRQTTSEIASFSDQIQTDFLVWGDLEWGDMQYVIHVKIFEMSGMTLVDTISESGEGVESLHPMVDTLGRRVSERILGRKRVVKLIIEGNKRIEDDAIMKVMQTRVGDIFIPEKLSKDLKTVYSMGYFEDLRIEVDKTDQGNVVIFHVQEKPTIRKIKFKGNRVYDDEEIKEEGITISTGSILNIFKIKSNIKRIEDLYKEKNYHNAEVDYKIYPLKNNQADLEFVIEEGKKIKIKEIYIEGNKAFSIKKLAKLMKTRPKGFWSWLTSSGELNIEDLHQDMMRLTSFYLMNGYIQARVGEPKVEYKGDWIFITIKIIEGPQFEVGKTDIDGDVIFPKEELIKQVKITEEQYCNRKIIQDDVILITDMYQDKGYYNVDVAPRIDKNLETRVADVTYVIRKGDPVSFEKIIISGNSKTRDKVIRRELNVYEQELYSGSQLKRGVRNLYRLDYFEDIKVNTLKGSSDDKVILKIDVAEKPTGMFTFGAGYSDYEKMFGTASVSVRNLFGRGQTLGVKAEVGNRTNTYSVSFTEPWLFDIPLSAGVSIWNREESADSYKIDQNGGSLRVSYPVFDYTRAYLSYSYSADELKRIDYQTASNAIIDLGEGTNVTSKIITSLRYDSRDKIYNATEGSEYALSLEYAGGPFGGDIAFTKYTGETSWYVPLFWDFVWFLHTEAGYVFENSGGKLPGWERFSLGGMYSLRGYDHYDVSPRNLPGDPYGIDEGGDKMVQFNVELQRPIIKDAGLVFVIFYDAGNAYDNHEELDVGILRKSYGYGVRWYSPIGPIRFEWGQIIDPKEYEDSSGDWEFTMGGAF